MCHTTLHFQMDIREYDNHAENDKYIKSFIRVGMEKSVPKITVWHHVADFSILSSHKQ